MTSLKKAKSNNWIDSDFGFGDLMSDSNSMDGFGKSRKRGRDNNNTGKVDNSFRGVARRRQGQDEELWIDRHQPTHADQLAVHHKKVEEVTQWLQAHRQGR